MYTRTTSPAALKCVGQFDYFTATSHNNFKMEPKMEQLIVSTLNLPSLARMETDVALTTCSFVGGLLPITRRSITVQ